MSNLYRPINLSLNHQEILRYAGYHGHATVTPAIQDRLNQVIEQSSLYLHSQSIWQTYPYVNQQLIVAARPITLTAPSINRHLQHCAQVTVMAVTVGSEIEDHIDTLFSQGEYVAATLFDALATEAVEKTADQLQQYIQTCAKHESYQITTRFSPGYGDWDVSAQQLIGQLLPLEKIGISINSHHQLIPRKSITALIGWHNQCHSPQVASGCPTCNLSSCAYRNHEEECSSC